MGKIGLGGISTNAYEYQQENLFLPTDESVCGMLFDLNGFGEPFKDYYVIKQFFGDGQTQVINNLSELEEMGLFDNQFMNGVPYYHIKCFYDYIGHNAPLYICFKDCKNDFSVLESMQSTANGKIFQIGIWTAQRIWENTGYCLMFTDLCRNIESSAEVLCGNLGVQTMSLSPISVLLCANTSFDGNNRILFDIPNGLSLNMPKLSVCIAQNGTDKVHNMQSMNPNNAPVGCLGFLMACVHLAYAEESIGYVAKFNLNKNDTFSNAEVWFGNSSIKVDDLKYAKTLAVNNGYILPTVYDGKEAEVFFTGDPTFSNGSYYSLANNRVVHKVRRAVQSALITYVNGNYEIDSATGGLSATSQTIFTSSIISMLDNIMVNKDGKSQLAGRAVSFDSDYNVLENDEVKISIQIQPVNYNNVINEKDSVKL